MKKTTTVVYEAFDGTIFKDEESCKKYEQENAYIAYQDAVKFMKADGTVCPLTEYASDCAICYIINAEKAIDAFYYIACAASDLYKKWYGYGFSVSDRFSAAVDLRDYFSENIENNDI